jgi:hypothetical protein
MGGSGGSVVVVVDEVVVVDVVDVVAGVVDVEAAAEVVVAGTVDPGGALSPPHDTAVSIRRRGMMRRMAGPFRARVTGARRGSFR